MTCSSLEVPTPFPPETGYGPFRYHSYRKYFFSSSFFVDFPVRTSLVATYFYVPPPDAGFRRHVPFFPACILNQLIETKYHPLNEFSLTDVISFSLLFNFSFYIGTTVTSSHAPSLLLAESTARGRSAASRFLCRPLLNHKALSSSALAGVCHLLYVSFFQLFPLPSSQPPGWWRPVP